MKTSEGILERCSQECEPEDRKNEIYRKESVVDTDKGGWQNALGGGFYLCDECLKEFGTPEDFLLDWSSASKWLNNGKE